MKLNELTNEQINQMPPLTMDEITPDFAEKLKKGQRMPLLDQEDKKTNLGSIVDVDGQIVRLDQSVSSQLFGDVEEKFDSEPIGIDADYQEPDPIVSRFRSSLATGDTDEAMKSLDLILKQQDVVNRFKRDLTPEAMNADLLRGFQERRMGRTPSMTLTRTGQFEGERRSPEEIERAGQTDAVRALSQFAAGARGRANIKNQMSQIEASIANSKERLAELKRQFKKKLGLRRDRISVCAGSMAFLQSSHNALAAAPLTLQRSSASAFTSTATEDGSCL